KYFILYALPDYQTSDFEILPCVDTIAVLSINNHQVLCRNGCAVTVVNRSNMESDLEVLK
ncbi:MAG: hypothetical protein ABIN89_20595, partial [Chitinophagaceae bacterium]